MVRPQRLLRDLVALVILALSPGLLGCVVAAGAAVLGIASATVVGVELLPRIALSSLDWSRIDTEHFEIYSAYPPGETAEIAGDLERFRVAAEYLWGQEIPPPPNRIRVMAYDAIVNGNRPLHNPHRDHSYLLPRPQGDLIVLREGERWRGAVRSVKVELARRLFRDAPPRGRPLWVVEGLAELAGTTRLRGDAVRVGVIQDDYVHFLRQAHWLPIGRVLAARDMESWSSRERELFDRQSWALLHYFKFGTESSAIEGDPLALYLARIAAGTPEDRARETLGEKLQQRVSRYVRRSEFDMAEVRVPAVATADPRRVDPAEIEWLVAEVSLALGNAAQALEYFERSLAAETSYAPALAGRALALAQVGIRPDQAERDASAARDSSPDAAYVQRASADALRLLAEARDTRSERLRLIELSRGAYAQALAIGSQGVASEIGLAALDLLAGDPPAALELSRKASARLPGDPEVRRISALSALAVGDYAEARGLALEAHAAARDRGELDTMTALLERIDEQAAVR